MALIVDKRKYCIWTMVPLLALTLISHRSSMGRLEALSMPPLQQRRRGPGGRPFGMQPSNPMPAASPTSNVIPGDTGPYAPMNCNKPSEWIVTHHKITVNGQSFAYTATAGFLPIKDRAGVIKANMFFVAYTKDGTNRLTRPVTFAFNGGPGSSSVWLHLGTLGPMRAEMTYHGHLPKPPFHLVDNQQTWLPFTDVVMLDAVNTGFSRTTTPGDPEFYGRDGDLQAFTTGITQYMTWENRWRSSIYVAGESYGGFRVAGLSYSLLRAGVAVNGIVSVSGVMNMSTLDPSKDDDLPYISYFPSEAAVAWYHKVLSPSMMKSLPDLIKKAEAFDRGPYTEALSRGFMSKAKEDKIAEQMSQFIGLPAKFIERTHLRVAPWAFMAELLRNKGESTGRYDARILGEMSNRNSQFPEFDASDAATSPVFTACMNDYLTNFLNFHSNARYRIMAGVYPWSFGGNPDTSDDLRQAMTQNPHMRVMFCCGWFDLACPYMGTRYVVSHMELPRDLMSHFQFTYYPSGHMIYTDTPSRIMLQKNIDAFITKTK